MNLDLAILKVITSNKFLAQDFIYECGSNLFHSDYWSFADAVYKYIRSYKECPTERTLQEKYKNKQNLVSAFEKIWRKLDSISYNEQEFKFDVEKLKKRYAENRLLKLKEELNAEDLSLDKSFSVIKKTMDEVASVSRNKSYDRKTLKEAIPLFTEQYNAKVEARKNNKQIDDSVKTGYSFLDYATEGLRESELLLIAGESGSGKSTLLLNMAIQMWLQKNTLDNFNISEGHHGAYFSLEMPFMVVLSRILARLSQVQINKIKAAKLDSDEKERVKKALDFIKEYPYNFEVIDFPRNTTMESIESVYEEIKTRFKPKFVGIDYLQLMDYESNESMDDWLKLGKISEKMHEFARVQKTIVLSAVQLNRIKPTKDQEAKIGLHRIGRSALIMQNANIGIQINTREAEKNYPNLEYYIIKNRDGALGSGKMLKKMEYGLLEDDPFYEDGFDFQNDVGDLTNYMDDLYL